MVYCLEAMDSDPTVVAGLAIVTIPKQALNRRNETPLIKRDTAQI
jgi:hypothetical protein